jgi:hypothetical protein
MAAAIIGAFHGTRPILNTEVGPRFSNGVSMRNPLILAAWLMLAGLAPAQIIALHLRDSKAAEKYKKYLITLNGEYVLAGEVRPGSDLRVDLKANEIVTGKKNALFVADPGDPTKVPYKLEGGEKVNAPGGATLVVPDTDLTASEQKVTIMMRDQTLDGLANEYRFRLEQVAQAKAERETRTDKTSRAWMEAHRAVITGYERLQNWLESTLFSRAAKNLGKTLIAEQTLLKDDAVKARADKAKASIRVTTDAIEDLEPVNQRLTSGKIKFSCSTSQHARIIHMKDKISVAVAANLLKLAENVIEGFRRDFVDPNLGEDFADPIPEDLFVEFWFGPEDIPLFEKFYNEYYGLSFDDERKAERLKMAGTSAEGVHGVSYLRYFKSLADPEGMLAHSIGHVLSDLVLNRGRRGGTPVAWIDEGCAYYVAFEFLGRNSLTCFDWSKAEYGNSNSGVEGQKTATEGQRGAFNALALAKGLPVPEMSVKKLAEMDDADLAKAWSLFDYIARKEGKTGIFWLRSACDAARDKGNFLAKWREETRSLFTVREGADPLDEMESRWKAFAQSGQRKDSSARKQK